MSESKKAAKNQTETNMNQWCITVFVSKVDGAITVLDKLNNYLERYGFERASREGNLNVYSTHYISAVMGNVWDAWDYNYYINKISINGDIGVVDDTITDEEIINWFGWERP